MKRLLLAIVRRVAWRYGYDVYTVANVARLQAEATGLVEYARRSGHLTRAYRAGKTVQHRADAIARMSVEIEREKLLRINAQN